MSRFVFVLSALLAVPLWATVAAAQPVIDTNWFNLSNGDVQIDVVVHPSDALDASLTVDLRFEDLSGSGFHQVNASCAGCEAYGDPGAGDNVNDRNDVVLFGGDVDYDEPSDSIMHFDGDLSNGEQSPFGLALPSVFANNPGGIVFNGAEGGHVAYFSAGTRLGGTSIDAPVEVAQLIIQGPLETPELNIQVTGRISRGGEDYDYGLAGGDLGPQVLPLLLGDMDCDGDLDLDDVDEFVLALTEGETYEATIGIPGYLKGDIDHDNDLDLDDVDPFVDRLTQQGGTGSGAAIGGAGSHSVVPEPTTAALVLLATLMGLMTHRRGTRRDGLKTHPTNEPPPSAATRLSRAKSRG